MMRDRIYDLFFLLFLFVILCGVFQLLAPFSGALLAALVSAIMFYPLYEALRRWFPRQRPTSLALVADMLVLLVFVTPMILLTWAIVKESSYIGPAMKQWNVTLDQWRRGDVSQSMLGMGHLQRVLGRVAGMTPLQFQANVVERVSTSLVAISEWGTRAAQRAVFFIFDLLAMLFALFFFFRDGDKWLSYVHDLIPMNRSDKEHLMARIHDTVIGVSRGWLLTGLIQGVTATLVFLVVGIEGAVLLGALTALFGLVPGVGTVGIWVPVAIFLLAKGLYWRSAFVLVCGALIIVGLIDSIGRTYLIGKRLELPLSVLFLALLGGVAVWGAKGIIIGPILVAITPVLLEIYRNRYLRSPESRSKGHAPSVTLAGFLIMAMTLVIESPLRADPPPTSGTTVAQESDQLKRHEKDLRKMQADRSLDNEHSRQAQQEFRKGTTEMSGHDEQQLRDVQHLRSVESQVTAGQEQKTLAHQSYKDAVHAYGSNDPRSLAAKRNWKESQQAMNPLLQKRRTLRADIQRGQRQMHDDKILLGIQKRSMNSDARYRATDDRRIQKEEIDIADDRKAMTQTNSSSAPPFPK